MRTLKQLDVNVTNRCNLQCVHCGFESEDKTELSLEEYEILLSDAKTLGAEKLDITGGEPLLRRDLPNIVMAGSSRGYYVKLITNGTLLTRDYLAQLRENGLDGIAVSLDGSTPERHARIRKTKEDQFYRTVESIRSAKRLGLKTKVNTVVFASTLDNLPDITQLCIETGADAHRVCYFSKVKRGLHSREEPADPYELERVMKSMKRYVSSIDLSFGSPIYGGGCFEDTDMLQILPDGSVYPCSVLAAYGTALGNVHERTLTDIWNDETLWQGYQRCSQGCPAKKIRVEDLC